MRAACCGNGAEKDEGRRATSDADHTPTEEQFPRASMMDSMTDDTTIDTVEIAQMLETIVIGDSSQGSRPAIITVPQLIEPISDGECFPDPGTVPPATKHRAKRCKSSHTSVEAITQLGKGSRTIKGKGDVVKVSIDGAYVTEGEFQSVLKYSDEVDSNFMWVCCKAMMADWDSKNKIIVEPVAVNQLIKPIETCKLKTVRSKFSKVKIEELDQMYLPIVENHHWFLIVIIMSTKRVQIYDSIRNPAESKENHNNLWYNVSSNLQLMIDMQRRVEGKDQFGFTIFPVSYPESPYQDNMYAHTYSLQVGQLSV